MPCLQASDSNADRLISQNQVDQKTVDAFGSALDALKCRREEVSCARLLSAPRVRFIRGPIGFLRVSAPDVAFLFRRAARYLPARGAGQVEGMREGTALGR